MTDSRLALLGNTKLRTAEMFATYSSREKKEDDPCFVCAASSLHLHAKYWRIIRNDFPYDAVAALHLMLAPIRHVAEFGDLDEYERGELEDIKHLLGVEGNFDAVIENLPRGRSFLPHYHLHLMQWTRV